MKNIKQLLCLLVFVTFSAAHRHWIVPKAEEENPMVVKHAKRLRDPMVKDLGRWCWFENDDDNWCWATTPPFLNVGWENTQAHFDNTTLAVTNEYYTPVKYYEWKLTLFADIQAYL